MTRHYQLLPGLEDISENGIVARLPEGFFLFGVGLIKKTLVADRIAAFIDPMINGMGALGLAGAWLAVLGYALQIYFDFSGYSDMAIGLGRLLGIELPQNFNSPYKAENPSDFWRRWHITLSTWLRDYSLYLLGRQPLLGEPAELQHHGHHGPRRRPSGTAPTGRSRRGASIDGLLLVWSHRCEAWWSALPRVLRCAAGPSSPSAWAGSSFGRRASRRPPRGSPRLAGFHGLGVDSLGQPELILAALVAGGLVAVNVLPNASGYKGWKELTPPAQVALGFATAAAILCTNYASKFLYFQF